MEQVILVDESDTELGSLEKMEAHRKGVLHRAFSLLIYNSKGEMLLQKRAKTKYHSGGLWSNACCSHPRPEEEMTKAISRKLMQEMGMDVPVAFSHSFIYKTEFGELTEHELDHVYIAISDLTPRLNPAEVEDWKYMSMADLGKDVQSHPALYTSWFRIILQQA